MKFLISSLGRSKTIGNVLDIIGKNDTYVYVHKKEVDEYAKYMDKKMIKPMPDSLQGVKKFMYEDTKNEDYTLQLDDDFSGIIYRHEKDEFETITDPDHIKHVVDNGYQVACDLQTPIFFFGGNTDPTSYDPHTHVKLSGYASNHIGIIPEFMGSINYDTRLRMMENEDISLQVKYHKRYVFVDERYNFRFHNPYFQKDAPHEESTNLQECGELLLKKWGASCINYNPNKMKVRVNFPF